MCQGSVLENTSISTVLEAESLATCMTFHGNLAEAMIKWPKCLTGGQERKKMEGECCRWRLFSVSRFPFSFPSAFHLALVFRLLISRRCANREE
jgi:hypothetical protein